MTQIHFRDSKTGVHIKDWPNWTGEIPQQRDMVVLHYGDDNEEERCYVVLLRVISGTQPDHIWIYIEPRNDEANNV